MPKILSLKNIGDPKEEDCKDLDDFEYFLELIKRDYYSEQDEIEELDLSNWDIKREQIPKFLKTLSQSLSVKKLNLSNVKLDAELAHELFFGQNSELALRDIEELNLSGSISKEDSAAIPAEYFLASWVGSSRSTSLKKLDISNCDISRYVFDILQLTIWHYHRKLEFEDLKCSRDRIYGSVFDVPKYLKPDKEVYLPSVPLNKFNLEVKNANRGMLRREISNMIDPNPDPIDLDTEHLLEKFEKAVQAAPNSSPKPSSSSTASKKSTLERK